MCGRRRQFPLWIRDSRHVRYLDFTGGADAGAPPVAQGGDTVTVGTQTYTFVTALNSTPQRMRFWWALPRPPALPILANAVNGGSGAGATYGSPTVKNADASAAATPASVVFTALVKGTTGNGIATAATGTSNAFGATSLSGGTAGSINDLSNIDDATAALTGINAAIASVAALRGTIGATVNRLQSAAGVITNQVQNLTGAEDGVRAADIPRPWPPWRSTPFWNRQVFPLWPRRTSNSN